MNLKTIFAAIGVRHVQVLFMFLLLTIGIGMRVQFSVAIVAMTDRTASKNPDIPVFNWTNKSMILSSFFWGYAILQILGAVLARIYGAKILLLISMGINSLICCLIPKVAQKLDSYGVMACRTLMGLSQGPIYPLIYFVLAKWTPASERSHMSSWTMAGAAFGIISGMSITGFISASWGGWPWSFYLYSMMGFLWIVGYYFYGSNTPDDHANISKEEKKFLEQNIDYKGGEKNKQLDMDSDNDFEFENPLPEIVENTVMVTRKQFNVVTLDLLPNYLLTKLSVPWKAILSSPPFWGILTYFIGQTWAYQTLLSEIPTYFNKVMKFDIESNGILSAAPYFSSLIVILISGYAADFLINYKYLTVLQTRRIFAMIACFIPAAALVVLSYLPEKAVILCVVMLILSIAIQGASSGSFDVSYIDLSPNFAGVLMGICNSCGEVFSIFGPMVVQFVVTDETNKAQWRVLFLSAAVCYVLPCIVFVMLVRTEVQPWNNIEPVTSECFTEKNGLNKIIYQPENIGAL